MVRHALDQTDLANFDSAAAGKASLDHLWLTDSGATEAGLAQLTNDERYATSRESDAAAFQYHRLSSRAAPMIEAMFEGRTPSRRNVALVAIRQLDDSTQRRSVFYFACTALWELNAVGADSAYHHLSSINGATTQYWVDTGILSQATRLLSGPERDIIVRGIAGVIPYYQPITIFPSSWTLPPHE